MRAQMDKMKASAATYVLKLVSQSASPFLSAAIKRSLSVGAKSQK